MVRGSGLFWLDWRAPDYESMAMIRGINSMNMLKSAARWIVPLGMYELASRLKRESVESTRLSVEEKQILSRNAELKNKHAGARCFILATGPSIKQQDLKPLKNEICISVSNFFVHLDYATIKPKYHCVAPYHQPITEAAWQDWLRNIAAGTGDATMCFGMSDKDRNSCNGIFCQRQVHYLKFATSMEMLFDKGNGVDLTVPAVPPQSVTIMAIQVALYLGCNPIYLLGFDHDYSLHIGQSRHFYQESEHALCRSGLSEWQGVDMRQHFAASLLLWTQYSHVRSYATRCGLGIFNATRGGLLDVFPRIRFESLFTGEVATEERDEVVP